MQDETTGNITLNRADTFSFSFDVEENGEALPLDPASLRLHVGSETQLLFTLAPTADPQDNTVVHFTFTPEHAALLLKKEWSWIIREIVNGEPDVLVEGATIMATALLFLSMGWPDERLYRSKGAKQADGPKGRSSIASCHDEDDQHSHDQGNWNAPTGWRARIARRARPTR